MSFNYLSKTGQFATGLVGTVGYTVYKPDGTEQAVRTTAGIVAIGAVGYAALVALPSDGAYVIQWDDGSAHYDYDSPPIAILADGVTHGGTLGSSTATLALQAIDVTSHTTTAVNINADSPHSGLTVFGKTGAVFGSQGAGGGNCSVTLGSTAAGLELDGGDSVPGLLICGPFTTPGPAIVLSTDSGNNNGSAGGDVIYVFASGTGKKTLLLSADAATDALAIAAGAGTPIDIFDATGAVRTTGGGGGSGPVTLDLTQVVPTTNTPQTVGDALNVTRPVTVDLTQVIPTTNTEQTIGDALNAARSMGFGGMSINKIARTLTLFAPNGTTPVHVFNLDNVSSPTSRT